MERLLADIKRIRDGIGPNAADLANAPLITNYGVGVRHIPCLIGHVTGHPHMRGAVSITSDLWAYAPELGWARTLSRFYVLGKPVGPGGSVQ